MDRPADIELTARELREVQLEVLTAFDHLCRSHGLVYYLAYGTLLGAIRHRGYIPWDDDVDVMMPRADYDRLHTVFAAAAPRHLTLGSPQTQPRWPFPYAKISDDRTELFEPLEQPLPLGVNLDVFPIDAVPSGALAFRLQSQILRLLRWAVELRYIAAARGRGWHHPFALAVGKPVLRRIPVRLLVGAFTRGARMSGRGRNLRGVRVGSYDWWVPAGDLATPTELTFEGRLLLAPASPSAVLNALYGDYERIPPAAQQISHHAFTAVWRAGPDATGARREEPPCPT